MLPNKRTLLIFLLATAVLAGPISPGHFLFPHPVSAVSFNLCGSFTPAGWGTTCSNINSPGPTLTVQAGASVTMNLLSGDGRSHTFCVDYEQTPDFLCQPSEPVTPTGFNSGTTPETFTFTATNTPGAYTYFCTIHGGSMQGPFVVTPPPPDFSISSNPSSLTILDGASASSTITLTSLNSFSGTISLSTNPAPTGLAYSLNQSTVTLTPGSSHPVTFDVTAASNAPIGTYTATVNGTNGTISHSASVSIQTVMPEFTISSSLSSVTLLPGQSTTATVTVTSQFDFSGTVTLAATSNSGWVQGSLSPNSLAITSGSLSTSTLTITTANSTMTGSYQVIVNGTSGSLSHTTTITVTISNLPGTIPTNLLIIVATVVIIGAVALVVYIVVRARRRPA